MLVKRINQVGLFVALMTMSIAAFTQNKVVVIPLDSSESSDSSGSANILYGRAQSSLDQALLFEWPGTGVEVRTRDIGEGDAVFEVRIVNTNPPGGPSFWVTTIGASSGNLVPDSSIARGELSGVSLLLTENKGSIGRMMQLKCFANVLAAGDDGFMQCTGIISGS